MKQSAPLTKVQHGLFVECVNHAGEACYNLPYLYVLDGSLDGERLCAAVAAAVAAHPTLFTRITLDDSGEPVQTVDSDHEPWAPVVEPVADIEAAKRQLIVPFNVLGDRLFHIGVLRDSEHYYLYLDIHHIIGDGITLKVMLTDIERTYNGESLAPEALTMIDVARAEVALRQSPAMDEARQWYAQNFDCDDTYTPLLPDLEEPVHSEASQLRVLDVDMGRVEAFCQENKVYKSGIFTAAYAYLLARYSGEWESLFTTVYNGRSDKRFLHSVGMTVRTLPVYSTFTPATTVLEFIQQGQEQMSGCRRHEAYAFSDAVNELHIQSNTMMAWHGELFADTTLMGKPMQTIRLANSTLDASFYLKVFILDGKVHAKAEYNANEYSAALVGQVLESYEAVVRGFLTQERLCDVAVTSDRQVALLDSFNQTSVDYDATQTIVSLLRHQAAATPAAVAVVYNGRRYTYAEVDALSDRIAAHIAAQGLDADDVVSVLIPRCEWMAIASIGVLKAGCAYQPLDPTYPAERLNFMMRDAQAKLLIADAALRPIVNQYHGAVLLTADIATLPAAPTPAVTISPDQLFILLYTSGTTGIPKGCQLTHANLVAFCHWYHRYYGLQPGHCVAAYASYGFDACMMDLYPALTCGATVHIIAEELRFDLMALNHYFEREEVTHLFLTTQVALQFITGIENHSLLHLSIGGEKISSLTPPGGYRLHHVYGPTECTIFTTAFPVERKMKATPIGKPLDNMRLYVVDAQGHRLPVGAVGELWVAGPQVSRGYLNQSEKTAEVFIDNPFTTEPKYARVYRTGDIVRYLPTGDILFVGRRDSQVKIRGFRIELNEVEAVIREFPGIKDATVQAYDEEGGGKFIAAYVVSDQPVDIEALNAHILDKKPPYMVPAVTLQIDAIPLNQNLKVDRHALPKPEKKAAGAVNEPMNELEQQLHEMVAAIVGATDFGVTTPLSRAGLTSITAIKLAMQVNKRYGATLDARTLVKTGTLLSIENEILREPRTENQEPRTEQDARCKMQDARAASRNCALCIVHCALKKGGAPLSYAQTGVYLECLKNPAATTYNIPCLLHYPAGTDARELVRAVQRVVKAHPQLGAHFATRGDTIVQTIDGPLEVEVPVNAMTQKALNTHKNEFVRPFNLQTDTLCRFEVVVTTPQGVYLLMDVHHLVFDGASADLLIRQISTVLEGGSVEDEQYTYLDFVADQLAAEASPQFAASKQFFDQMLAGCEGASEIPADLPPSDKPGRIGEAVVPVDHERIAESCRPLQVTPAHLMLAATAYVVARHTNAREAYLCTVSNGRANLKISDTVGMFVSTLALGMTIGDVTVQEFVRQAGDTLDRVLHHEDYPLARLATDYGFRPAIAYAYQVGVLSQHTVHGNAIEQELLELNVPKFKINIKIEERGVVVQYDDARYSPELAQTLAENIATVAAAMAACPSARVRQLSMVSERQARELDGMRQVADAEPPFRLMHECLSHFAATQPDHEALVASDATYTYREMDTACEGIAAALREHGVQPRDRVALLLPRTSRLVLAMYGVLKAGAAYIPCDPEYPADRIRFILEDSQARFIITTASRLHSVPARKGIDVEELIFKNQEPRTENQEPRTENREPRTENQEPRTEMSAVPQRRCGQQEKEPRTEQEARCKMQDARAASRNCALCIVHCALKENQEPDGEQFGSWGSVLGSCLGSPADLAYLIYTSGSTGRPKGVMIRHEGICNYLYGHPANVFAHAVLTDARRILSMTTISFDAALQDIGTALFNGKTLVLATEEQANNPLALARLIAAQRVNMVSGTPSRWLTWLASPDFRQAIAGIAIARAGGEHFGEQLLDQLRSATSARIFNCYGPTEATVASNNKELTHATRITVGRPQLGVREFVVDPDGNELPVGVVGELYIGGRGVARGYNNLDALTCEQFVDYHGERVYRSGDYAQWLLDGDVVILGRTDQQIKLRGLRIEPGEIEHAMLRVEGMKEVVITIRNLGGKEHLCAYYTADRDIAPDALKAELSKSLARYMVPTAYRQLAEMPLTPNGKTDVKALPAPELAASSARVAPATATERTLCDIFASVLQTDCVGATDNFFELGGTSLMVTRVIIEADKAGLHVAYGDVFAHPTPRQLARRLTSEGADPGTDEAAAYDYSAIDGVLRQNTLDTFSHGEAQPLGNVLLTGATGYLGIHILRELIDSDARHIYCLVRGDTPEKGESRLRTLLFYYFSDAFQPLFGTRLHVVPGDVTQALDERLPVNTVINCAAVVKHFSEGTEIEDVNIGGAQRCVDFCLKTGARLVHISTASTRGLWVGEPKSDIFTEQRLYMGQYLSNKYVHSKFVAERLILEAVARQGLGAKIMRVGNLAARSSDGEFQVNFATNAFMGRIKVYNMLGCCPHTLRSKPVEFSPVNEVARAILLLAGTPHACNVFHPYNNHTRLLGDVLAGLKIVGGNVRFVEQEEFDRALEQAGADPAKARQLSSLLAYQDMAHGQKTTDVNRNNDYTTQALHRLDFAWSPTSWDYIERMLTTISGFGFFE